MIKRIIASLLILFTSFAFAQAKKTTMPHSSEITSLLYDSVTNDGSFFTTGKDGVIVRWDSNGSAYQYQITNRRIVLAAIHPAKQELAVYETDGNNVNVISVWDWKTLTKKFSVNFQDSILSLTYSKKGSYIIAGTSTDKGTVFLNSNSGSTINPVNDKMNMISYVETSNSEKSIISYSLTGNINYYSTDSKKLVKKIPLTLGLENIVSFNRFKYIAGIKDGKINIFDANTGKLLFELTAVKPLLFTYNDDLYYLDLLSARNASIFKFDTTDGTIKNPVIYKNLKISFNDKISGFMLTDFNSIAVTKKGNVYICDNIPDNTSDLTLLSKNDVQKIIDISTINENIFFLTQNGIFKTDKNFKSVDKIAVNQNYTNISLHENKLLLWSQDKNSSVSILNTENNELTKLFSNQAQVSIVKSSANQIIAIESGSTVKRFNFETNTMEELYYGSMIRDAIMLSEEDLIIVKAASSTIDSPVVYVNTRTHETLPLKIDADFVYKICDDETDISENPTNKYAFLIGLKTGEKKQQTSILRLNASDKKIETLTSYNTLNLDSFMFISNKNIYTDILDYSVTAYNYKTKKSVTYKCSAFLPYDATATNDVTVVLNVNGTISLYENESGKIINDYALTLNDELVIF